MNEHEDHVETVGHDDEGMLDILTDGPHFAAEMVFEGSFLLLGALLNSALVKWRLRKRDKEHAHC